MKSFLFSFFFLLIINSSLYGQYDSLCINGILIQYDADLQSEFVPGGHIEDYDSEINPGDIIRKISLDSLTFFYRKSKENFDLVSTYIQCDKCVVNAKKYELMIGDEVSNLIDKHHDQMYKYLSPVNAAFMLPENQHRIPNWIVGEFTLSNTIIYDIIVSFDKNKVSSILIEFRKKGSYYD